MNCRFCSLPLKPDIQEFSNSVAKMVCHNHPYLVFLYFFKSDPKNHDWCFYVPYKEKMWEFCILSSREGLVSFQISSDDIGAEPNTITSFCQPVFTLDFDPGITPENALNKLPTYLVFG